MGAAGFDLGVERAALRDAAALGLPRVERVPGGPLGLHRAPKTSAGGVQCAVQRESYR